MSSGACLSLSPALAGDRKITKEGSSDILGGLEGFDNYVVSEEGIVTKVEDISCEEEE